VKYIDQKKVNRAIRECLEACYQASDILPKIAGFLADLKTVPGWREAEIHEVELAIHKVLHGVTEGATYAGDATNRPLRAHQPTGSKPGKLHGI